jgi:ornithine carbamoyltransferase
VSTPNPDDLLDVFTILSVALIAAAPTIYAAKAHRTSQAVLSQTKNGHTVPMREDLDRVIQAIDKLATDVHSLRHELADEESRRREHVAELRDDMHRRMSEVHRRLKD